MIDTVVIISPEINKDAQDKITEACIKRYAVDCGTGEKMYEFTSGQLDGSFDSKISLQIKDKKWIRETDDKNAYTIQCDPYVRVECSVHKQMLGHNIYGGSSDFQVLIKWLVNKLESLLDCELPNFEKWEVEKIDTTEVFDLGCESAVRAWFRHMNNAEYARRQDSIYRYGNTGLCITGSSTTVEFYFKGTEFWRHDRKKIKKIDFLEVNRLQEIANRLLRCEVKIKKRKLKYDFGKKIILVTDITTEYLEKVYDAEIEKVLKGFTGDMKMVRKCEDVERVLYQKYSDKLASVLIGTWMRLSVHGERYVKEKMNRATFYRHRKCLVDAGCHWIGTDIVVTENEYPEDFKPLRDDVRCMNEVLPEIELMLAKIKAA